ncbi:MAG: sugar ABC transporter permease [Clostridia bacterium]|nr:sugar ABC transporter permease [Clostridia bacterium]
MAKNELDIVPTKSLKDKIAYPFTVALNAIKNFFYDISVTLHNWFRRVTGADKRVKKDDVKNRKIGESVFVWTILLYPLVQFFIFYVCVNFNSILLAFKEVTLVDNSDGIAEIEYAFIGWDRLFDNFAEFYRKFTQQGSNLPLYFENAIIQYLVCVLIGLPLNIIFAYVIYKKIPASGFFQVVLYLPSIISNVVISTMFKNFVTESLPNFCEFILGLEKGAIPNNLFKSEGTALFINLFYIVWVGFGSQLILYSGAMARIPDSIIEYGELEGINMLKEFWYVVIPMIYGTITVFLVTGIPGIFSGQMALFNFYAEYAPESTITIGYYFYVIILGETSGPYQYPFASAAGLAFTIIVAPLTLGVKYLLEKYGPTVEF